MSAGTPLPDQGPSAPDQPGLQPAIAAEDAVPPKSARASEPRGWKRWLERSNPVWIREMRQSARLTRTPLILALVTILTALIICAVGGVGASDSDPAVVGTILFHTYFSLAFAIVSFIGPGVAAMTIASERSGRTWEAVLLTSMSARDVARGKFAAAYTYMAMYVVMLAPVGALSFLFGGISALDVTLAFLFLFVFCALAVGFGLSIASAVPNPTVAMLVTVPIAAVLSLGFYLSLGVGLSVAVHSLWSGVSEGAPVWLPTAYTRAEFGWLYVLLLVFAPFSVAAIVGWFFHEVTAANIAQENDDRSSGLRRWFLVATPVLLANFLIPRAIETDRNEMWQTIVAALAALQVYLGAALFIFAGEPLARSARVNRSLKQARASAFRRFLGPGIEQALLLVLLLGGSAISGLVGFGVFQEYRNRAVLGALDIARLSSVLSFGGYALCFLLFLTGFVLYVRTRSQGKSAPRVLLLLVVFFANAGPWLVLAIAGMAGRLDEVLWLAAPAPSFSFQLIDALIDKQPNAQSLLLAMIASASGWALLGVLFWVLGSRALRARLTAERNARLALTPTPPSPP